MLYKFSPPSDYTIGNLRAATIHCRSPWEFNDPFEFWTRIEIGVPNFQEDDRRFRAAMEMWWPGVTLERAGEETVREYFDSLKYGQPPLKSMFDDVYVSCFSRNIDSLLMWSHYADGLRGIVMEFEPSLLVVEDEHSHLADVRYCENPPVVDSFVYAVAKDMYDYAWEHGWEDYDGETFRQIINGMMDDALASKSSEWAYEEEVRLIKHFPDDEHPPTQFQFRRDALRGVIIGERCDHSYRDSIVEILDELYPDANLRLAVRESDRFRLCIENLER